MRKLPLIKPDLPPFEEITDLLREAFERGQLSNFGRYATQFEAELSDYLHTQVALVSSGTAGLILSLQALGLQPGQRVILPSFTFMATAQAVLYAGGIPVFAEVEDDFTLSPSDLAWLLRQQKDVAVVLPVHMYGLPCQVEIIRQIVEEANCQQAQPIALLYDAAHALGSSLRGQHVGAFGDAEVFSLSVTKVLTSVEGGAVSSQNIEFITRLRKMRNYGIQANYDAHWPGLNGRMSELHAIVGLSNLQRLDACLADRQLKARYYLDQVKKYTHFGSLPWPEGVVHTFKDFTVLVPESLTDQRDQMLIWLAEHGVETRAYFSPPVHQQRYFKHLATRPLPRTENLARRVITLPFHTTISVAEIDYVVELLVALEERFA